jgi:hypothetical protein
VVTSFFGGGEVVANYILKNAHRTTLLTKMQGKQLNLTSRN